MKCSCWMMHYNLSRSHRVKLATASPGSTIQTGLSSITVGSLCVSVRDYTCGLLTPPLPSILITPRLAFVHVSPLPVCNLLPCYRSWQTDECSFDSFVASNSHRTASSVAHRHTNEISESLSLCLKLTDPRVQQQFLQLHKRWPKHC